jgi:hypothetical protein
MSTKGYRPRYRELSSQVAPPARRRDLQPRLPTQSFHRLCRTQGIYFGLQCDVRRGRQCHGSHGRGQYSHRDAPALASIRGSECTHQRPDPRRVAYGEERRFADQPRGAVPDIQAHLYAVGDPGS